MFIVVPLSFGMWAFRTVRETLRGMSRNDHASMEQHKERIQVVVDQIKEWNRRGRPKKLRTARPNWSAMSTKLSSNKESCELISTAHLNHILQIDQEHMTITW
jgi:hypothetical protein